MFFLFIVGPLKFNFTLNPSNSGESKPTLELNPYSWTKVANIIFIDQPAGSGFSYAKKWEAYNSSDTRSASLTYDFLRKWLVDHPNFLNNPLYICGISYIGIVVPIVVQEIYNGNEAGKEPRMKIKGYILFNPLTNRNSDINSRIPYAHRVALLSDELYESAKSNCQGVYIAVDPDNRLCASDLEVVNECVEKIYFDQILEPICLTTISKPNLLRSYRSSLEENPIDIIWSLPRLSEPWCRDNTYKAAAVWANDKAVQNALHIREGTIREWVRCNKSIQYSFGLSETVSYTFNVPSSVDYHRNLTNKKCRALIAREMDTFFKSDRRK
ncbi:unnamed protein product [Ilex paraguariensis]|uniref:Uncharacterized protein n=1 Tax=Ilex paraguariensis TaxID=185542 RepID=A0ABC8TCT1_9AQUA